MTKKPTRKPLPKSPAAAIRQTERIMVSLTPDEMKRLTSWANTVSNELGVRVAVATVARSLLLSAMRAEKVGTP